MFFKTANFTSRVEHILSTANRLILCKKIDKLKVEKYFFKRERAPFLFWRFIPYLSRLKTVEFCGQSRKAFRFMALTDDSLGLGKVRDLLKRR
ncbi:MAG: hypothetical protein COY11_00335 [Candidatus Portnoybacteria bacterium CG_4_10_14_0_2_um_filter_44_20]|uniref:Uncharacterized protein n=1 Tax=Candidatus Portnoybacteria bacterium CG_4_10_14_0_2_um_filter_44_20 TaxID=1974799 RepID=A0A2M7ULH6_9BACT|nr:MAG: hypothetical protein COY11_00335 [Candidatus Portnoybacteria bacterium CG_4_10_14_0_2_um_filter_44_20]